MKKLYRSEKDKKIAGVCGGLGEYFDVDPSVFRVVFIVLLLPGGLPGFLLYLAFWFIMPTESVTSSTNDSKNKNEPN